MKRIEFILKKFDKAVAFQIIYMDEVFKSSGCSFLLFESFNGFSIRSDIRPALSDNIVYLWGENSSLNNSVEIKEFANNTERDEYFNRLIIALKDWSQNWEGWTTNPPIKEGTFTF